MLAVFILGLIGSSLGSWTHNEPAAGACLCVTGDGRIRSSAGLSINNLGIPSYGECFVYTGVTQRKDGYTWLLVDYKGKEAWVDKEHVKVGNNTSKCTSHPNTCEGSGGPFDQRCLQCICQIESGCKPIGCHMDVGSLSCGYFQIKKPYYIDCSSPGSDWKTCADDLSCATTCVNNYIGRYYPSCTGSSTPKCCEQAARIHNGGPKGCQRSSTLGYWKKVQACLGRA